MPKTKIIGTIGPASSEEKLLESLIRNGLDGVRLNFSFGTHKEFEEIIKRVRRIEARLKKPIAIIQDLQGLKIRTGLLKGGEAILKKGNDFTITTKKMVGDESTVSTTYRNLHKDIKKGDRILLDDGLIELKVREVKDREVHCRAIEGGILRDRKGINLPGVKISAPPLTKKDIEDLRFGISHGVDYIALSFVRSHKDISELKRQIEKMGAKIPVIAKIEKPEAIKNLDNIIKISEALMVARGDLGVEMPPEDVPILQKEIILKARQARIPVITATQMLESMAEHLRPTRAEASDVANAIFDGTDAVMLSRETSTGKYPLDTVRMMLRIIDTSESNLMMRRDIITRSEETLFVPEAVSLAASTAALKVKAKAIVVFTQSGSTALLISKSRPPVPIIAFTPHREVVRGMALYWGVIPKIMRPIENTDEMIEEVDRVMLAGHLARKGDTLVILSGAPIYKKGTTNLMKIHKIGD
jgi:pyruvate kinase